MIKLSNSALPFQDKLTLYTSTCDARKGQSIIYAISCQKKKVYPNSNLKQTIRKIQNVVIL